MEEAQRMRFTSVWLECDFVLVCVVFTTRTNVLWMFRNRRHNCLNYCDKMKFRFTHIFREGNVCTDKLSNLWFIYKKSFHWYNRLPSTLFLEFFMNMYSLHVYRVFLTYEFWFSLLIFFFFFFNNTFFFV